MSRVLFVALQRDHVNDLLGEMLRQFVLEMGIATSSPATTICVMLSSRTIFERLDDFLDVMQVEVLGAALIARLRPATLGITPRLLVRRFFVALGGREAEDQDARLVGVEQHRRVARIVSMSLASGYRCGTEPMNSECSPNGASSAMASNRIPSLRGENRQPLCRR